MKFILLLQGAGEGCDYTIGCNVTWKELKSTNIKDAKLEAQKIVSSYDEPEIEDATLIQVASSETIK